MPGWARAAGSWRMSVQCALTIPVLRSEQDGKGGVHGHCVAHWQAVVDRGGVDTPPVDLTEHVVIQVICCDAATHLPHFQHLSSCVLNRFPRPASLNSVWVSIKL